MIKNNQGDAAWKVAPSWLKVTVVVCMLNWVIAAGSSMYLGGDALNGRIENGHYYLVGKNARRLIEVSPSVYLYSKIQMESAFFGFGLIILAMYWCNRRVSKLANSRKS